MWKFFREAFLFTLKTTPEGKQHHFSKVWVGLLSENAGHETLAWADTSSNLVFLWRLSPPKIHAKSSALEVALLPRLPPGSHQLQSGRACWLSLSEDLRASSIHSFIHPNCTSTAVFTMRSWGFSRGKLLIFFDFDVIFVKLKLCLEDILKVRISLKLFMLLY